LSNEIYASLESRNLLLRGSTLRNTEHVLGIVLYTGQQTKIMLNSVKTHQKKSILEKEMDFFILVIFIFLQQRRCFDVDGVCSLNRGSSCYPCGCYYLCCFLYLI
jgi:hypothetical protein